MAFPIGKAAAALPWREIVKHAPRVWDAARHLLDFNRKDAPPLPDASVDGRAAVAALAAQLAQLSSAQAEQAKVLAQFADQMQALSAQAQENAQTARRTWFVAVGAAVVALAALLVAIFH